MVSVGKALFFGGNWKAEMTPQRTREYIFSFGGAITKHRSKLEDSQTRIMLAPPAASLEAARGALTPFHAKPVIELGVQDPWHREGAYTGATTFEQALDPSINAKYAIIGHSETREPWRIIDSALRNVMEPMATSMHRESIIKDILEQIDIDGEKPKSFRLALDAIVNAQVKKALKVEMVPILCVGETLEERNEGRTVKVVLGQLTAGLEGLTSEQIKEVIVAYEPVWAIGTGETATPDQAQEVHAAIAKELASLTESENNPVPIIYGGSMKPGNVAELVSQPDIYGGLIGGASLVPSTFMELILNGIEAV